MVSDITNEHRGYDSREPEGEEYPRPLLTRESDRKEDTVQRQDFSLTKVGLAQGAEW